ncbi:hypothetical protein OPU71_07355 [Niveibacterium sp. 24ML]|uniref:hypothetical protein n=1 Tax=Niveibacterium sp. 24ML TaxID=2985512 RepID=UPI0022711B94|nr:hypothetical protein [Niveibacterium sp. 24ML]MCX9155942.1 hypothetical protein [Niveibacterium sp. 24ML]
MLNPREKALRPCGHGRYANPTDPAVSQCRKREAGRLRPPPITRPAFEPRLRRQTTETLAQAEVETVQDNEDIGFVKTGQVAEIEVETLPFTHDGTIPAQVNFVSGDAIKDDKHGFIFQARLKLDHYAIRVDERNVPLSPGMPVRAEMKTWQRLQVQSSIRASCKGRASTKALE